MTAVAVTTTRPSGTDNGHVVKLDILHLDDIPGAMDAMGWPVSARMMRRWFANPLWQMPAAVRNGEISPMTLEPSQYDDQIIRMDWVLGYPRAREACQWLLANWATPAGVKRLRERLINIGWHEGRRNVIRLGSTHLSARELEAISQVNYAEFGSKLDILDDLYGALGIALLKLAVVGQTLPVLGGSVFRVERVGIYVRDTYDFSDSWPPEPLGVWGRSRCLSKAETAAYMASYMAGAFGALAREFSGFVPVFNRDFRRWQRAQRSGGDFMVYSDVKWLDAPVREIPL